MPLNLQMLDDGHIISIVITDPFVMTHLFDQYGTIKAHLDKMPFKVHTIVDLSNLRNVPSGALGGRNSPPISHPNSGFVAIIGGSNFARSIIEVAFKITGYNRVRFFTSDETALAFLRDAAAQQGK